MVPRVFDRMSALGDMARSRMLVLLEQAEFTVSELTQVIQLPQSTVSRHLKVLAEDGWVTSRQSGTNRHYRMAPQLVAGAHELWNLVRTEVVATGLTGGDSERASAVMSHRRQRSRSFFASSAGAWDELRDELFGARADLLPFFGLLDRRWTVGDLGTGTGQFAATVAPFVRRVIGVDASPEMLDAARNRLQGVPNVELRSGELERLPVSDGELDLAVLLLALHYVVEPVESLREAHRALAPGGRLVIVDMRRHSRDGYQEEMGHLWPGFDEQTMQRWHDEAGLKNFAYRPLPARAEASGPLLFVTTATRSTEPTDPRSPNP